MLERKRLRLHCGHSIHYSLGIWNLRLGWVHWTDTIFPNFKGCAIFQLYVKSKSSPDWSPFYFNIQYVEKYQGIVAELVIAAHDFSLSFSPRRRQRQAELPEFEISLVYIINSRLVSYWVRPYTMKSYQNLKESKRNSCWGWIKWGELVIFKELSWLPHSWPWPMSSHKSTLWTNNREKLLTMGENKWTNKTTS